jgi:hypothetical protein
MKRLIAVAASLVLAGCATQLSSSGARVRIVQQEQLARCSQVQYISVSLPLGGAQDAQHEALNQAAAAGADALYIYFTWSDPLRGSQVQGEALRCNSG